MTLSKPSKWALLLGAAATAGAFAQEEHWEIVINHDTFDSYSTGNVDRWGGGFVLNNYTVTNNGDAAVDNWSVELDFNQSVQITNAWGIDIDGSGSTLSGANVDYIGTPACTAG